ncbi:hypothetical protein GCM10027072_32350 [Streptomyces bullii]
MRPDPGAVRPSTEQAAAPSRTVADSAVARRMRAAAGGWVIGGASRWGRTFPKIGTCSYGTTPRGGFPARRAVRVRPDRRCDLAYLCGGRLGTSRLPGLPWPGRGVREAGDVPSGAQSGAALATVIGEFPSHVPRGTVTGRQAGKAGRERTTRKPGDRPRHLTK